MIAVCSLVYAARADAQNFPTTGNSLDISASTLSPTPGQSVIITVRGYGINISAANLTWSSGGVILGRGVGLSTLSVKAPAAGKHLTVNVTATQDGLSMDGFITITSGSVDMIIEPDGYVPPFFSGKTAIAYQNNVNITAIPHLSNSSGTEYDPKTLIYQWKQSSSALPDQSGYGAQSITLAGSIVPHPYIVTVTVTTRDGNTQTSGLISVNPEAPSVVFYRNDPLYGPLFNNAIGNNLYLGSERETGVLAVPFGFNASDLSYTWLINSAEHPELASNKSITLRAPNNQPGSSNISLTLRNSKEMLQQAQAGFSTIWSTSASTSASRTVSF